MVQRFNRGNFPLEPFGIEVRDEVLHDGVLELEFHGHFEHPAFYRLHRIDLAFYKTFPFSDGKRNPGLVPGKNAIFQILQGFGIMQENILFRRLQGLHVGINALARIESKRCGIKQFLDLFFK